MDWQLQSEMADLAAEDRALHLRRQEIIRKIGGAMKEEASRGGNFSLSRAIRGMSGQGVDGFEAEVSQGNANVTANRLHDRHRLQLMPENLGWHQRTLMQVGTGSMGGYMVGASVTGFDALNDVSALVRAGATVWSDRPVGNVQMPGFATQSAANWIAEGGTGTASEPTLTATSATPKTCIAVLKVAKQLLLQGGPVIDGMINRHLLQRIGRALDVAGLGGTSGSTNPVGIPFLSGLGTALTGTSLTWANVLTLQQAAASSATNDANIKVVSTPAVRATLSARQRASNTSTFIWEANTVAGMPAIATPNALASSIIVGDFSQTQILTFGLSLESDPFSNFMNEIVAVKAVLYADIQTAYPSAFGVGTSVT
jgi:HK97 family phage major capsid protein